jgi:hypothetical protein
MKKTLLMIILPSILFAQYFGERTTEQSFEQSALYFNSHFLNTFGIYKFKDAAPGLINDPFLNVYINPANLPDIGNKEFYIHLDFRGDRTEPKLVDEYYIIPYYNMATSFIPPSIDRRWFSETREEPEPIVSFGFIGYPLGLENKDLFLGGSYQLIYSEDKFYEMPYSIYSGNIYLDAFNSSRELGSGIPIQDRYSGKDEMINEGHLITAFSGYKLSDELTFGLMINSVIHSRDGGYSDINNDEYGDTDNYEHENSSITEREQTYDHFDISGAISYSPNELTSLGLKGGMLTGNADQEFFSSRHSLYKQNEPNVSDEWNYHYSDYDESQNWVQDGNVIYGSFNFSKKFKKGTQVNFYYRYTTGDIDTKNNSSINDTSFYTNRWYYDYQNRFNNSNGHSAIQDFRTGRGERNINRHEINFNVNWPLNSVTNVLAGIYYKRDFYEVSTTEPVKSRRSSYYFSDYYYNDETRERTITESEDKTLMWDYSSRNWTLQIPLLFSFKFNEHWGMMLGVNRILNVWKVEDVTTAIYKSRKRIDNGEKKGRNKFW